MARSRTSSARMRMSSDPIRPKSQGRSHERCAVRAPRQSRTSRAAGARCSVALGSGRDAAARAWWSGRAGLPEVDSCSSAHWARQEG